MKKIIILAFLLTLFNFTAYAEKRYVIEKPDGSVSILVHVPIEPLSDVVDSLGCKGCPIDAITEEDLPDEADRKYWIKNKVPIGKKIKIDTVKKQADLDADAAEQLEAENALKKFCPSCTKEDFKKMKELK